MSADFDGHYLMNPIIVGPKEERKKAIGAPYREISSLAFTYETDRDALQALLPRCYQARRLG